MITSGINDNQRIYTDDIHKAPVTVKRVETPPAPKVDVAAEVAKEVSKAMGPMLQLVAQLQERLEAAENRGKTKKPAVTTHEG